MGMAAMLAMRSIQFEQYLVPANHEALHEIWLKTRETVGQCGRKDSGASLPNSFQGAFSLGEKATLYKLIILFWQELAKN